MSGKVRDVDFERYAIRTTQRQKRNWSRHLAFCARARHSSIAEIRVIVIIFSFCPDESIAPLT